MAPVNGLTKFIVADITAMIINIRTKISNDDILSFVLELKIFNKVIINIIVNITSSIQTKLLGKILK